VRRPVASSTATSWTPATWLTSSVTVIAQLSHVMAGYDGVEPAKPWGKTSSLTDPSRGASAPEVGLLAMTRVLPSRGSSGSSTLNVGQERRRPLPPFVLPSRSEGGPCVQVECRTAPEQ
jgi:hypothetical protein